VASSTPMAMPASMNCSPPAREASIASAKAWLYIAGIQLLTRRLARGQYYLYD